jgi:hypothetical protein
MTIEWDGYTPYDPGVRAPLHEVSRKEARAAFDKLMASRSVRIDELRKLLAANDVALSETDGGIQILNDWFRENVEPNDSQPDRLRNLWYAVVNDTALFLGEVIISRAPNLRWEFVADGETNVSYQRHVIGGFKNVPNPRYTVDIDLRLATYGYQIIGGEDVQRDRFRSWVDDAVSKA